MIDVANEARVSQTTVSLVLNHADGARLSAETRERVVKAATRLGYQPVRRGGAPGSAAASSIGFICDEISTDPWTAIGLDGVREKAWERGLTVMVMATRGDADMESAALAQLTAQPLVGLIYATINTRLVDAPAAPPTLPTVLLNCHVANGALPSIVPGETAGGHAATKNIAWSRGRSSPCRRPLVRNSLGPNDPEHGFNGRRIRQWSRYVRGSSCWRPG